MATRKKTIQSWALFYPELILALKQKNYEALKKMLAEIHPVDIADAWDRFSDEEKTLIFKLLKPGRAMEVFEELDVKEQRRLLDTLLEKERAGEILNEVPSDVKARLFWKISPRQHKKFMSLMRAEEVQKLQTSLTYPRGTAGFLMNTEFIDLKPDMTVRQALERIQNLSRSRRIENLYAFYVTDENSRLLGGITLRRLIALPQDSKVRESMSSVGVITLSPDMSDEDVAKIFAKYDLTCAPVADPASGRLLGIVVIDDVVDIIQRINTKEIYEIGKMSSEGGEIISYGKATVRELLRRRFGWLAALLAFDFLTGTVLKTFEDALSAVVALTFFIPMLLDTGGNAGAQTSITIIRGLATGDVDFKSVWRVVRLELSTAFLMAVGIGVIAFLRAWFLQKDPLLSIVVALTMFCLILLAIATGIVLPLLSKKVGLDPAVLAGPITTSVVDICGLIIYFKIAQFLLPALRQAVVQ